MGQEVLVKYLEDVNSRANSVLRGKYVLMKHGNKGRKERPDVSNDKL